MLFNSFSYLVFLPVVFLLYWTVPVKFRKVLLLVASYFFYMSWKWEYGFLIAGLTIVNYFIGAKIDSIDPEKQPAKRKGILVAGLVFNLGCLCFYKYATFLLDSFVSLANWGRALVAHGASVSEWHSPAVNIILPLGISFFTFEFIHYIVDIHRGSKPVKGFVDFALFASFFPSQIAGPVKRFQDFMQQMGEAPVFKSQQFRAGIFLIMQGMFKKVALGDNLGQFVAPGFDHISGLTVIDSWLLAVLFLLQMYFDFAGYTDIGRGSALVLGYKVPENFRLPFLASNLTDFWRRWHISLSTWLRDYLFIPLGGSRNGHWIVNRNIFLTMALGGLWHGAAWRFVIWGMLHGFGLLADKEWRRIVDGIPALAKLRPSPLWHWSGVLFTFVFLAMVTLFFRVSDMTQGLSIWGRMYGIATGGAHLDLGLNLASGVVSSLLYTSPVPLLLPAYGIFCLAHHYCLQLDQGKVDKTKINPALAQILAFWDQSPALRTSTCLAVALLIFGFAPGKLFPFLYFQF